MNEEKQNLSSKIRNETKVSIFSIVFNIVFKILAREIRQETELKEAQVEEYFKLHLFSDKRVLYLRCT